MSFDYKGLLDKVGKVRLNTTAEEFLLLKNEGRYSFRVNGLQVGITEKQLQGMIEKLPANVR